MQSDHSLPSLAAVRKQVLNMLARFGTRKRSAGKELTLLCATEDVRFHASAVVHTIQRLSELHMLAFECVPCCQFVHMLLDKKAANLAQLHIMCTVADCQSR